MTYENNKTCYTCKNSGQSVWDEPCKSCTIDLLNWESKETMIDKQPEKVTQERSSRYGNFSGNARITQMCEDIFREFGPSYHQASDEQKEALHMILQKLSRAFCGDTTYEDNWVDIMGYAQCVLDSLIGEENDS